MNSYPVTNDHRIRISRFIDTFMATAGNGYAPGVPEEMKVSGHDHGGWSAWKATKSKVSEADLRAVEGEFRIALPPLFKAYFLDRCLLMTDFVVRLPETRSDNPLKRLRATLKLLDADPFFRRMRLLPFGHDSNDVGPVCFDLEAGLADGDCAVVVVDHHLMRDGYRGARRWDSFAKLVDDIEDELKSHM